MKRIFIIVTLALGVVVGMSAQTMYDGLVFTENNYVGTARTLAMGNAFTALGGDPGSMAINPAGSAVNSHFVITVTPGFNTGISWAQGTSKPGSLEASSFGDKTSASRSKLILPNIAGVFSFNTHHTYGIKRVTLGIASNTSNTFLDQTLASGSHYGTSFAGYLASCTNAPYESLADKGAYLSPPYYAWDAILGVQSGMTSNISGYNDVYVGATEKYITDGNQITDIYTAGPLAQDYGRLVMGGKSDIIFNLALDINDWIYLGANLVAQKMNYSHKWYIRETAQNPEDFDIQFADPSGTVTTCFSQLKYNYSYAMSGTGLYGSLGIIMTPGKHFRAGATIQTPTSMVVNESWKVSGETSFTDSKFNSSSTSPDGDQSFVIHGPWRTSLGLAGTIGRCASISADYEASFYSKMFFRGTDDNLENPFGGQNRDIAQCMGVQHNLRIGAEYKPNDFLAIRAGYNMLTSPVKKNYDLFGDLCNATPALKHSMSAGVGISSSGSFFCDLALRSLFYGSEYIKPYDDYICDWEAKKVNVASPEIRSSRILLTGVVTFGFRF